MHFLSKKSKENVVEYLILMFQIEDMIRAFEFDNMRVLEFLVGDVNHTKAHEAVDFYSQLIHKMKSEGLDKKGHLSELQEIIVELVYLHNTLITIFNNQTYKNLVASSAPDIAEFRKKSNLREKHDIEVMLHAMYMQLQLNMRKQNLSDETLSALDTMRKQLAFLAEEYKKMKSGDLNFIQN